MANTPYGSEWQERMREVASVLGHVALLMLVAPLAGAAAFWALAAAASVVIAPLWFLSWLFS